jgi:hypothetical protein
MACGRTVLDEDRLARSDRELVGCRRDLAQLVLGLSVEGRKAAEEDVERLHIFSCVGVMACVRRHDRVRFGASQGSPRRSDVVC